MVLTPEQTVLYRRNILLSGIGENGQERLLSSSALLVGAGGLASSAAYYLAAAGVGRLGLMDDDVVEPSNLQRQILHSAKDVGRAKVESAAEKLRALNPGLCVEILRERLTPDNAGKVIAGYDVVIDCTDNFASRFIINDTCLELGRTFIYGGVLAFSGQLFTVVPGRGPCLRCIFPREPDAGAPGCEQLGVLGAVPGVIGALQAAEAVKYLLGLGELLIGRLLIFDALTMTFHEVGLQADPDCPSCGPRRMGAGALRPSC